MSSEASSKIINLGVIGCGQWGFNHVRVFSHLPHSRVLMAADTNENSLKKVKNTFLNVVPAADYRDILNNSSIHAVCIALPTESHYSVAKEALEAGKDVLCEKPFTCSSQQASSLVKLAAEKKKILMVGHIFIFNSGICKLKEYVEKNELGKLQYAHAERTNLGPIRQDVNALWDLAPHDISIFNYLFSSMPVEVWARGHKCLPHGKEDVAFISMLYPNNVLANVHVSWLDPKKERTVTLVGDQKMVTWDDLNRDGALKIYNKQVLKSASPYESFGDFQLLTKDGDITIPFIAPIEPMKSQNAYFLECIRERKNPDAVDGTKGFEVVRILEALQQSMDRRGEPVSL